MDIPEAVEEMNYINDETPDWVCLQETIAPEIAKSTAWREVKNFFVEVHAYERSIKTRLSTPICATGIHPVGI